ncbi:MAG: SIS domain-containing protein [Bacteroidota bacterium]|nr:SIS domain-containing protein [Bacteroidota bacterium]
MQYQKDALTKFSQQIKHALQAYTPHNININDIDNIVICGLGGSGIAGRIVKSMYLNKSSVPIEVISDYFLPAYAGERTLTLQCSYSGNTEETLAMYAEAKAKGCKIISLSTGGKLEEQTVADGNIFYRAETGFQPRMALGYGLTYLLLILSELTGQNINAELEAASNHVQDYEVYITDAQVIFENWKANLDHKTVIVTDYLTNPIGVRFAQQLQENAKAEAFVHELPESNHNVIETYYGEIKSHFLFLSSNSQPRTTLRFAFLKELLERNDNHVTEMNLIPNDLNSLVHMIYTQDWLSLIYADAKGVNSSKIENIVGLKSHLDNN